MFIAALLAGRARPWLLVALAALVLFSVWWLRPAALALGLGEAASLPVVLDSYGKSIDLAAQKGKWIVLFFYPRAGTSGCTLQNIEYTKLYARFLKANAVVYGISSDTASAQCEFSEQYKLKVPQIPDPKAVLASAYGVSNTLGWFGRDTIVVGPNGKIAMIERGVEPVRDATDRLSFIEKQRK
jgi:thioredoxin-dependent peroxiredoxin